MHLAWLAGSTRTRNHCNDCADFGDVANFEANFAERAGRCRRDFHRRLVGFDLEKVVARLDRIAGGLEPFRDLALGYRLAELRHQDVHHLTPCPGCDAA